MFIDTHLHVWSDDADRYPFYEGRGHKPGGSVELLNKVMSAAWVEKAVIVQPIGYLYDNSYVADTLKRFPGKFAAIGLVDRHASDAADQFQRLVEEDGFSGLRLHLGRPDDPAEWAAPDQDPIWQRAEEIGASFIIYGPTELLPAVEPIIARFPNVKVALDHNGSAPPDEEAPHSLLNTVLGMAKYANVYIKLSPQAHRSKEDYPHPDTFSLYQKIYDAFGPQRLMWGTNFPGVINGIGYVRALEIFRVHMDFLSEEDKEWIFSKTALDIYNFAD